MSHQFVEIGKVNTLRVLKETPQGMYLGDEIEEILLPNKYIPGDLQVGDEIDVFIYTDSEDRIIATTLEPYVKRDEFAVMQVKEVAPVGAFLDWGLEKDLFVPFSEQQDRMEVGKSYLVYLYLDEVTDRLVGSSRINRFAESNTEDLQERMEVTLLIGPETELGYIAIINNKWKGLLFHSDVFKRIYAGKQTKGYIKRIREDGKIDLSLEPVGIERLDTLAERLLAELRKGDGYLPLHDKSNPRDIFDLLEMSKKNFKKALGTLYKQKLVDIEEKGIRLK